MTYFKKPSLIYSTLIAEHQKPQQKILNYLLFGNLCYDSIKSTAELRNGVKTAFASISTPTQSKSQNNPDIQIFPIETEDVTFGKIIFQSLKLFAQVDKAEIILNIVIKIVSLIFFIRKVYNLE